MEKFDQTYSYKVIYVFSMPYDTHKGLLKVGDATLHTDTKPEYLTPNCHELNQAALARIKSYTDTASMRFDLLYTELAVCTNGSYTYAFRDKKVHDVLMNSRIHKVRPNGETGEEWFETDLETVKAAIQAVKDGKKSLGSSVASSQTVTQTPIDFREEQKDAVEKTLKAFKKSNEMLWYAKMRFGKTLTALEVVRRSQYRRVVIVTHRPVVDDGWSEDFHKVFFPGNSEHEYRYERKTRDSAYTFDEKTDSENDAKIRRLDKNGDYFVYFASIQDLRGSQLVGGTFNKNHAVFALNWDMIIIDEAHEGTQTELGDSVVKKLRKEHTKILALSGTPFNLLGQYDEDSVYTWDYVMEQKKKDEWDLAHHGDHNPYADLPKMHIFTYNLGDKLRPYVTDEYDTKAFNFSEFFRVYSKGPHGKRELPKGAVEGEFVHQNDVQSFLNLMVTEDADSVYPFSTEEYRNLFRHTLWMVPGVKEANALEGMLRQHPVFGQFGIANVAGEGDTYEKDHYDTALEKVRSTIQNNRYSITLSCGKLTTGVTVKEWTAVLMLSGTYSTAAAQYMQTIFRVQSAGTIDGKQKTDCFVFDFAPDRTLKVLTETVHLSRKNEKKRREAMTEFLNYCPVIAIAGSKMEKYSVNSMMEQIKQIYAERAVNSGFDDESIYNDELLKLDEIDASKFNKLKDIIGASKAQKKKDSVEVNGQGLTDKQLETIDDGSDDSDVQVRTPPTPEEIAERLKKQEAKKARKKAIDILRGISIRMPLMIYGADVPIDEDIDIERFVQLVDDTSWEEFMPRGVSKQMFADFTKYYDRDVFIAAGKRIRKMAAAADRETPTKRVQMIAEIFRHFKNPDKETILTPWRVVNMHMSDTLGGWCFFNERFEDDTSEQKHRLDEPRFVDRGDVTRDVFREDTKILEINSKTGLYPLYVAYSVYRQKLEDTVDEDWDPAECQEWWEETLKNNVFVVCKTPMAKSITIRTLTGYNGSVVNAHYFDDLVNMLKSKPEQFKKKVLRCDYWKKGTNGTMKFDAVVGNPPYQIENGGDGNGKEPIYHLFVDMGMQLSNSGTYIHPGRFLFNAGKTPKEWNDKVLHNKHYKVVSYWADSTSVFPTVDVKGGIAVTQWDMNKDFGEIGFFSPFKELQTITAKVTQSDDFSSFSSIVYPRDLYRLTEELYVENKWAEGRQSDGHRYDLGSNVFEVFPELFHDEKPNDGEMYAQICGRTNGGRCVKWIKKKYLKIPDNFDNYKVFIPKANGSGAIGEVLSTPVVGQPVVGHTVTFLSIGNYDTQYEADATLKYIKTKFARTLLGTLKVTQDNPREVWKNVPMQDFTLTSDIPWKESVNEIDKYLYKKYNLSDKEIAFIEDKVRDMGQLSICAKMLNSSYADNVKFLLKKYGTAKHDYFVDTGCTQRNKLTSRTDEGLFCHHIDEDKAIMLCNDKYAAANPFEYQKKNRLVYCNLLEHLLLHVKIAESPSPDANESELPGIGGAINFICVNLNDIYAGKQFADEWRQKVAAVVKDDFDDYIAVLRYLWNVVEQNPLYKAVITKEMLCVGWDGKVVPAVLNALNGNADAEETDN